MTTKRSAFLISAAIASLLATPAIAQSVATTTATGTTTGTLAEASGDDILVTAQKRSQVLIDVPQSITVVSGAALERLQANDFQDYLNQVPGLQLDQSTPGAGRLILRGLNTGGVASTVATYVDETPFGSSSALVNGGVLAGDFDTFDMKRIEVLRGPQGTLYGASSLGGVLKFVTNAPDPTKIEAEARGSVEGTRGGAASYSGDAMFNLPLAKTLAFRASGYYRKDGGWIDSIGITANDGLGYPLTTRTENNINSDQVYGGRASLLWTPVNELSVRLSAILQDIRAKAPSTVDSNPATLQTLYGNETQSAFSTQFTNVNYRLYNGTLDYDFGFARLTSSSSYSTQNQTSSTDATFNLSGLLRLALGAPANEIYLAQQTTDRRYTQEVRLASGKSDVFEWLVGGYYTNEKGVLLQAYGDVVPGTTTPVPYPFVLAQVAINSKYEEYAGFANATLHLGSRFDLDFGGRYSHNNQRADQTAAGVLAGNVPVNSLTSSDHVFTYSVAPKYKVADHVSIYARVAKGYRPGGPNVIAPDAPANTPTSFAPDTTINYEVGFKAETADRVFALDMAAYRIDWKNVQLLADVNGFGVNINGAEARSEGVEFTATMRPIAGFVASINGAYDNARLLADAPALVGGKAGDKLPFTPEFSVNFNLDYDWRIGNDTRAFVGGSLRSLSGQTANYDAAYQAANGRQRQVEGYEVLDLRAGLEFRRFTLEAYVRNLNNSDGKTSIGSLTANGLPLEPNGAIETGVIRPRTVGLSITVKY